ncbi:hypothetical protein Syun_031023 [Stephania yunnanensis]|uniref:Uncharacterized protein n=1 Tax=Stephania yunnanensis TaxID=152371 RepID=A0AAP0HEP4_9MAGN
MEARLDQIKERVKKISTIKVSIGELRYEMRFMFRGLHQKLDKLLRHRGIESCGTREHQIEESCDTKAPDPLDPMAFELIRVVGDSNLMAIEVFPTVDASDLFFETRARLEMILFREWHSQGAFMVGSLTTHKSMGGGIIDFMKTPSVNPAEHLVFTTMLIVFTTYTMEKVIEGVIDDLNDDDDKIILKLKKEFDDDGLSKYMSQIPNFYTIKKQISKSSDKLLLLVCLVRMADSLAPSLRIVSLASALDQAFEIIVFIHEKTNAINASKAMNVNFANDIWRNKHIRNHWFQTYIIHHLKSGGCSCHIRDRVAELHDKYLSHFLIPELHDIINIVGDPRVDAIRSTNGSIEELYDRIERLFVELRTAFSINFDAIFNGLNESVRAFEFQENVKTSMELVARFKDVDPLHYANHNIGSFMTTDSPKWKKMKRFCGHAISLGNVVIAMVHRMADSLASSLRIVPLASALDQAFEIIVFIHAKTITKSGSNAMKINVAKDIWMNKSNSNHWFQTDIIDPLKRGCANHIRDCIAGLFDNYLPEFCDLVNRMISLILSANQELRQFGVLKEA